VAGKEFRHGAVDHLRVRHRPHVAQAGDSTTLTSGSVAVNSLATPRGEAGDFAPTM